MNREILEKLAAPFPPQSIGKKPTVWCRTCAHPDYECGEHQVVPCETCGNSITEAHDHLDFVGHAYVRERLNAVDPDWNWRPLATTGSGLPVFDDYRGLWIELTIAGKTMLGYGDAPGARGGNAIKECIGDALRNAGQSFGIALSMWMREPLRVVEPAKPILTDEQRAKRLRDELKRHGNRKGQNFARTVGAFNRWAEGKYEFRTAPADVLQDYKDHLQAS